MRILHIISGLDPKAGGPINALSGLAKALVDTGVCVDVIATYRQSDDTIIVDDLVEHGIEVTRIGPVRGPLHTHPQIRPVVRQAVQRADAIHIHGIWEDIQHRAARAAQQLGKPYIIRPCGMLDPWSLAQSPIRKRLYLALRLRKNLNHASAIHFTADAERDLTAPLRIKAPGLVQPNGLDLDIFKQLPEPGMFRQTTPALGDRPYALFLSRVHYKKGLELLIPAFAAAAPPEYALVVAGPGEPKYISQLKQLTEKHGLRDRVIFKGMVSGTTKLAAYAEAQFFVLPSHQDNFGIVVIESLACGTPVLISDKVNIHPAITKAGVGVVSSLDPNDLEQSLHRCLTDPLFRQNAAAAAKTFVAENYDWSVIARRWVNQYQHLSSRRNEDSCLNHFHDSTRQS